MKVRSLAEQNLRMSSLISSDVFWVGTMLFSISFPFFWRNEQRSAVVTEYFCLEAGCSSVWWKETELSGSRLFIEDEAGSATAGGCSWTERYLTIAGAGYAFTYKYWRRFPRRELTICPECRFQAHPGGLVDGLASTRTIFALSSRREGKAGRDVVVRVQGADSFVQTPIYLMARPVLRYFWSKYLEIF